MRDGRSGDAIASLTAARRSSYVPPYRIATVHAGLGEAATLPWLTALLGRTKLRP